MGEQIATRRPAATKITCQRFKDGTLEIVLPFRKGQSIAVSLPVIMALAILVRAAVSTMGRYEPLASM